MAVLAVQEDTSWRTRPPPGSCCGRIRIRTNNHGIGSGPGRPKTYRSRRSGTLRKTLINMAVFAVTGGHIFAHASTTRILLREDPDPHQLLWNGIWIPEAKNLQIPRNWNTAKNTDKYGFLLYRRTHPGARVHHQDLAAEGARGAPHCQGNNHRIHFLQFAVCFQQRCRSRMFIPDQIFSIPDPVFTRFQIADPHTHQRIKKIILLSSQKLNPGCSLRILALDYFPS
jgi:hypothetical protein